MLKNPKQKVVKKVKEAYASFFLNIYNTNMKTRMELWAKYRKDIENNISLIQSARMSNEKVKVLKERLLKIFPEYDEKYPSNFQTFDAKTKEIEQQEIISDDFFVNLKKEISKINDDIISKENLNKIKFSSGDLDELIKKIDLHDSKVKSIDSNILNSDNIVIDIKKVKLKDKMKKINIAIDGPSGSGKSTAAKAVAKELGLKYINTGLVYRSIAFYVIDNSIPLKEKDIVNSLKDIRIELLRFEKVDLNGRKLFDELREDKVSKVAAIVASMTPVRDFALKIQRHYASTKGIVMDGRDTTFKIMPKADLKIFLDTDVKERAKRRVNQNKSLGYDINYDEVLKEIKARDKLDRNRKKDPLHKTKDAILIDSTNISLEEVIEKIIKLAKERL